MKLLRTFGLLTLLFCSTAQAQTTLNFKDADINDLIATVSDATGKNFIIDPRVKGKVTVLSSSPMSSAAVYSTFLSILQVHGYAAIPNGSVIKIVPEVGAKQDGNNAFLRKGMASDEIVTHVVPIENVPAAQLVPILRPLVPQYGHLAAYSPSNMLILSDRAANVDRLTRIIQRIDQGGSESEVEVIRLQYANASDVVNMVNTLKQNDGKSGNKGADPTSFNLLADERTNSVLVSADKTQRLEIKAIIAHLDTPLEDDGDTQVVYLNYANAETLAPVLEGYAQQQNAKAKGGKAKQGSTDEIRIIAETDVNALVITASPKLMRGVKDVIRQLDIPRAQVMVEAIIAEVSESMSRNLGVDWAVYDPNVIAAASDLSGNLTGALGSAATSGTTAAAAGLISSGLTVAAGGISETGTSFAALLNALNSDGDTNVLSTPMLVTMDNQEASISVGQEVPFLTGSFSNAGNNNGSVNPFQTIERRDVGLTLKITPQINAGDAVQLQLEQEISNVASGSASAAVDLITTKRTLNTTVTVHNGDILVLGGLMDETLNESESRVPLLGSLPLLGALFRNQTTSREKRNLMIFMRPVIMRDRQAANYFSRKKYNTLRNRQLFNAENIQLMWGQNRPVLEPLAAQQNLNSPSAVPAPTVNYRTVPQASQAPAVPQQTAPLISTQPILREPDPRPAILNMPKPPPEEPAPKKVIRKKVRGHTR